METQRKKKEKNWKKIVKKWTNLSPRFLILSWTLVGDDHVAFFPNNLAQDKHNELIEGEGKKEWAWENLGPSNSSLWPPICDDKPFPNFSHKSTINTKQKQGRESERESNGKKERKGEGECR